MLKIYRDKDGYTFQYEEGTQPEGLELVEDKPKKAPAKARKTANKSRTPRTKAAE